VYGADELTERLALVAWNGKGLRRRLHPRFGTAATGRSFNQVSNLAGTSVAGAAQPVTQSDFDASVAS